MAGVCVSTSTARANDYMAKGVEQGSDVQQRCN